MGRVWRHEMKSDGEALANELRRHECTGSGLLCVLSVCPMLICGDVS